MAGTTGRRQVTFGTRERPGAVKPPPEGPGGTAGAPPSLRPYRSRPLGMATMPAPVTAARAPADAEKVLCPRGTPSLRRRWS